MFLMIDIPTINYLMLENCGETSCYEEAMMHEDHKGEYVMQSEMDAKYGIWLVFLKIALSYEWINKMKLTPGDEKQKW